MSKVFVKIKMCYMYNQWYDISCTTLYIKVNCFLSFDIRLWRKLLTYKRPCLIKNKFTAKSDLALGQDWLTWYCNLLYQPMMHYLYAAWLNNWPRKSWRARRNNCFSVTLSTTNPKTDHCRILNMYTVLSSWFFLSCFMFLQWGLSCIF